MGASGSTLKRVRQSRNKNLINKTYKSNIKTAINKLLNSKTKEEAKPLLKNTISIIDKVAQKKIIHLNKASNKKSKLMKYYNNLK